MFCHRHHNKFYVDGQNGCIPILQCMSKGSKVPPVNVVVMVMESFGVNRPLVPGLVHICIWL